MRYPVRLVLVRHRKRLGVLYDLFRSWGFDLDRLMRVLPGGWTRKAWCHYFAGYWHLWEVRRGFTLVGYVAVTAHHELGPTLHFAVRDVPPVTLFREAHRIISHFLNSWGSLLVYIPEDRPEVQRFARLLGAEEIQPGIFRWATPSQSRS